MGYPMTWRRVMDRNRVRDGDYGDVPFTCPLVSIQPSWIPEASEHQLAGLAETFQEENAKQKARVGQLLGDLRRLERDTLDEKATVVVIADQTGVDPDDVAAVLRAFLEW